MNHIDTANAYIRKMILPSSPEAPLWNRESQIFGKPMKWNYIDSCMIKAVTMLYDVTENEELLRYADSFMKAYVDECGNIGKANSVLLILNKYQPSTYISSIDKAKGDSSTVLSVSEYCSDNTIELSNLVRKVRVFLIKEFVEHNIVRFWQCHTFCVS